MNDIEATLLRMITDTRAELSEVKKQLRILVDDRDERTFSQRETARMLGIAPRTLANWRASGIIKPINGTTRYPYGEIRRVAHSLDQRHHD